jgi:hypothetical protein
VLKPYWSAIMTTEAIIVHSFYHVDNNMKDVSQVPQAKLYPSEVVTIGVLFALKGGHFRAFYRWLQRDDDRLFGGLPDRTTLHRQRRAQQGYRDRLVSEPSVLNVMDSFPIELLFPLRQGRSQRQLGKKNNDKGRGSIGIKRCWILNTYGQGVGWHWLTMNRPDQAFLPLACLIDEEGVVLTDLGFRCKAGLPTNLQRCPKGTWNDRMVIETVFSLLTVVSAKAKRCFIVLPLTMRPV